MKIEVNTGRVFEEFKSELRSEIKLITEMNRFGDYLTTSQTKEYLGDISTNKLAKLRKQGLKRVTIDGLCLYKKADIVEFLDEHKY